MKDPLPSPSPAAASTTGTGTTGSTFTSTRITSPRARLLVRVAWAGLAAFDLIVLAVLLVNSIRASTFTLAWGLNGYSLSLAEINVPGFLSIGILHFLISFSIAFVLIWRRGDEHASAIFSLVFLAFALFNFPATPEPFPAVLRTLYTFMGYIGFFSILYLFPTGRFVPSVMRPIFLILVTVGMLSAVTQSGYAEILLDVSVAPGAWSLFYRYYRSRELSPVQQQQLKWLVLTFVLILLSGMGILALLIVYPMDTLASFLQLYIQFIFLLIPVSVSMAILRFRLWEIDLMINQSLVYIGVTAVVLMIFALITFGGQIIAKQILGDELAQIRLVGAVVVSLLLFNPVRNRAQHLVDNRVFGLRYNLHQVVAAHAAAQKPPEIKNPGAYTGWKFGRYEALGVLGRGGMGEVYTGIGDGQQAAIKVLPASLAEDDDFRKRFEHEARTLSQLQHPNIVRLYDYGVSSGVHYLAMEQIDGAELEDLIKHKGPLDFDDIRDWLRDVASALDYVHQRGLVHRDLKPSNIMIRLKPDGEIREAILMDFGVARMDDGSTRLTGTGTIGTIDYMAPEQIMAAREVDHRADVYALGLVLYEMLTGERAFKGNPAQVVFAHMQQPAPDPRDARPDCPRHIAKAVQKALEKKPEDRFQSAGELASALM